jgi:cyclopropane fatty-acyl-phospholipid synthase-like methyltransferase
MKKQVSIKEVADYYDEYVTTQVTYSKNLRHIFLLEKLKGLHVKNTQTLLELGCGVGAVAEEIYLTCKPKKLTGVDISPKSIEHANKLNAKHKGKVEFIVGDVCDLKLKEQYDHILIFDLLEHIPAEKHELFFRGLQTHLKDGGKILLNIPYAGYLKYLIEEEPHNTQIIEEPTTINQLAVVLEKTGFEMEYLETYHLWVKYEYQYIVIKRQEKFILEMIPNKKKWYRL